MGARTEPTAKPRPRSRSPSAPPRGGGEAEDGAARKDAGIRGLDQFVGGASRSVLRPPGAPPMTLTAAVKG